MHKPKPVQENDTHKIVRNFEVLIDRKPSLELFNKKKKIYNRVDLAISVKDRIKMKENEKLNKYLDWVDQKLRRTLMHDVWKHWTAVSTFLSLISSVYRDLNH